MPGTQVAAVVAPGDATVASESSVRRGAPARLDRLAVATEWLRRDGGVNLLAVLTCAPVLLTPYAGDDTINIGLPAAIAAGR